MEVQISEESEESTKVDLEGKIDDDLMKMFLFLQNKMKIMKDDMQNLKMDMKSNVEDVMRIATGQRGEELDKEKYRMLVSEYRKFKARNVKHFRFNSDASLTTFGEFFCPITLKDSNRR